jgi:hypothetical protein
MLAYLFLGILVLLVVLALMRAFARANPVSLALGLRWAAFALGGLAVVLLPLLGRGSLALLGPAVMIPLLMRFWSQGRQHARPSPGQTSSVETGWLAMTLDHDSGSMEGTVRNGRFAGRYLSSLGLADLLALLDDCRAADPESVPLLEAYLDRTQPGWREPGSAEAGAQDASSDPGFATPPRGGMSRDEAYQILGLEPGAGPEAVRDAHRRLMQKLHPDHGGSTYLAAKLNQAKDLLLGN